MNRQDTSRARQDPVCRAEAELTSLARRRRGFTLLELMVVMALIVVLAGMAMASYRNSVTLAQEAVLREDLFRMRDAIDQYYADKNKYPSTLESLVSDGYLRTLPQDPFTKSASTWQEIPADPDANNPTAEPGVYNVRSGSERMSMQGTPYSEW
ncbi:Pullulanase secretion protein PulG [Luteitalea pratensis]|uniref:Pullulanase secretion protein PulG n=1 Tax=Luteitalea pratensis TaxID=1855912 RepID=A0A143PNM2_LUTPR|nr:prepilin-type N-terminal cleavage/methylation domain-containing protein [Luteitalea pratensis]AMY10247.1 Pullulanase secretion protein PulG [Luteitalea pratensis]